MRSLSAQRPAPRGEKRDPAPSRWAYRWNRLWLTPLFRALLRVGLPAFLVITVAGSILADPGRRAAIGGWALAQWDYVQSRPEFTVSLMEVSGASAPLDRAVRAMFPGVLPASSFKLDLESMRQQIEALDAVAHAELRVREGGVLHVAITERVPVVLWRNQTATPHVEMLDDTGHRVATLTSREARADLPVIAGQGADAAVPEALRLLAAAAPLAPRLRGLVRIGERRWDLVLDRDQRVMLPQDNAVDALNRVIALDQAEDLLARDLAIVDMRFSERPTIRLTQAAAIAMGRIKAPEETEETKAPVTEND